MSERVPLPIDRDDNNELTAADKAKLLPKAPGCYLMKDAQGNVIYVGKAKNLRSRASHYFTKEALIDPRTQDLVPLIADLDHIETATEVEAILLEARLIKDVQPKFNIDLKDDKSFPYLQIRTREEFPRVEFTRSPRRHGVRLFGPFTNARSLRQALQVLQRVLQFRNCSLDIRSHEERWRWFRPCLLHSIRQCTAPCNFRVSRQDYRKQIRKLILVLEGKKDRLLRKMNRQMQEASAALQFEKAARLRDEILALETLDLRGDQTKHDQPKVFPLDPKKGLLGLRKILNLTKTPRIIEGIDIAHLGGSDTVASLVSFIDGLPFKPGYRRFKIKSVKGVDDFASIREVVSRRYTRLQADESTFPDIILIDGGKGQLNAARGALELSGVQVPVLLSLAKREEEIFQPGEAESLKISRHAAALRLLQYVRDEAHRFAQHYHHQLRHRKFLEE